MLNLKRRFMKRRLCWGVLVLLVAAVRCSLEEGPGVDGPLDEEASYTILWSQAADTGLDLPQVEKELIKGLPNRLLATDGRSDTVRLSTRRNEVYSCLLPDMTGDSGDAVEDGADGSASTPRALLAPLMGNCIKLLMGYWSYEFCHGMYLRQYHEEKAPSGKSKLDEYYLGRDDFKQTPSETTPSEQDMTPPKWYVNGADRPYFEVEMAGGTLCDLRGGEPRAVRIKYICDVAAPEIGILLSVEESTTCRYEAVVSAMQLCTNRAYRLRENPLHTIQCFPEDGAARRPSILLEHELASSRFTAGAGGQRSKQQSLPPPTGQGAGPEGTPGDPSSSSSSSSSSPSSSAKTQLDEQFIIAFLSGDACLLGGAGWWKHEICFGKYVRQIHSDASQLVEVVLGWWNLEQHVEWFSHAGKRKQSETHVIHLYTEGDVCDITGQPRQCQVKFKCTKTLSDTQISLSVQEPTPCSYVLTVEGSFICALLKTVDQNGLISYAPQDSLVTSSNSETMAGESYASTNDKVGGKNQDGHSTSVGENYKGGHSRIREEGGNDIHEDGMADDEKQSKHKGAKRDV